MLKLAHMYIYINVCVCVGGGLIPLRNAGGVFSTFVTERYKGGGGLKEGILPLHND